MTMYGPDYSTWTSVEHVAEAEKLLAIGRSNQAQAHALLALAKKPDAAPALSSYVPPVTDYRSQKQCGNTQMPHQSHVWSEGEENYNCVGYASYCIGLTFRQCPNVKEHTGHNYDLLDKNIASSSRWCPGIYPRSVP